MVAQSHVCNHVLNLLLQSLGCNIVTSCSLTQVMRSLSLACWGTVEQFVLYRMAVLGRQT